MAAYLLAPVAQLNQTLLTTRVHPLLFPYPLLSTLHAGRIAIVHKAISKRTQEASAKDNGGKPIKPTWAYDIAGFLIMCWGGSFLVSAVLGTTPPQLLSIDPFLNYVGVYLVVSAALQLLTPPTAKMVDTLLVLIDGALRTHAVVMSILAAKSSANAAVQNSLAIQVICGTLGATGGGQLAGMLSVQNPTGWVLKTPPALLAKSPVEAIDVIAAAVCALLFGVSTLSHPAYGPYLAKIHGNGSVPLFAPAGARAACTLVFAAAFAYRAVRLHWLPAVAAAPSTSASATTPKKARKSAN